MKRRWPQGTRVKHLHNGREGVIVGKASSISVLSNGNSVQDSRYAVRYCDGGGVGFHSEHEFELCLQSETDAPPPDDPKPTKKKKRER